jgi:Zn finger protein HypA/HybF involved in hydrogenase expression
MKAYGGVDVWIFHLQKVHPVVLAFAFSTVRQNTTIFKQLIYITSVNGFIEV